MHNVFFSGLKNIYRYKQSAPLFSGFTADMHNVFLLFFLLMADCDRFWCSERREDEHKWLVICREMTNRNPEGMTEQRTANTEGNRDEEQRKWMRKSRQNDGPSRFDGQHGLQSIAMSLTDDNTAMIIDEYHDEFDHLLQLQLKKLRVQILNKWKNQVARIVKQVNHVERIKISTKNEEIGHARDLNSLLEQKAASLFTESQVWKAIAQKNEAMAKAWRH